MRSTRCNSVPREYVLKPFELEAMAMLVERTLDAARIRDEHSYLLHTLREGEEQVDIVGRSTQMQQVRSLIAKVAATRSNILLLGESGTGKELVANAIHSASTLRQQPLVKVNCPGIPTQLFESELFGHMKGAFTGAHESRKGKFELAGNGNILLDEISEIPVELQAKLLRVLEERRFTRVGGSAEVKVDARVIAASNRDIKKMVDDGQFRADLYYRLNVFPIRLPAPEGAQARHLRHCAAPACSCGQRVRTAGAGNLGTSHASAVGLRLARQRARIAQHSGESARSRRGRIRGRGASPGGTATP